MQNTLTDKQVGACLDETNRDSRYGKHHFGWYLEFAHSVIDAHEAQRRAGQEPVARLEGVDEYGPRLEWMTHWVDVPVGAKLYTAPQPAPDKDAEIAALTKQANAYASLVKNLDARMATLQAERGGWIEAVNTLTSERQANAMLTDEIAALKKQVWMYEVCSNTHACSELHRNTGRYQLLRRGQRWSVINGIGDTLRAEVLDAALDAAIAQAVQPS